ncbi:MAG: nucleotide exchange factor GrpE [Pirellulaceae bacterium]
MASEPLEQERAADSTETPDATVDRLEKDLAEASDRALRIQAELENYRKRMHRELAEERRYAIVPLAKDLLAVVDNLERAIEAAQRSEGREGLLEGVKLVATQLDGVLSQHQCQRIDAEGQPFDPNQHQAIAQEPSDQPAGTVTRAVQSGYKLHDRVIRPAQVFVSSGPPG